MSIQYMPGWWDTIAPTATDFVNKLASVALPDRAAQQKYEQMIQKDPSIVQQLSNMNQAERQQFAKGLGAKNLDIFGAMPEGAQLKQQNRVSAAWDSVMGNKDTAAQAIGSMTGTQTPEKIARERVVQSQEDTKFNWEKELAGMNIELNKGKLVDAKRVQAMTEEAFKKYPSLKGTDLTMLVDSMIANQPVEPLLVQRIRADPGANDFVQFAMKARMQELDNAARKDIASIQRDKSGAHLNSMVAMAGMDNSTLTSLMNEKKAYLAAFQTTQATALDPEIEIVRKRISERNNLIQQAMGLPPLTGAPAGPAANPALSNILSKYNLTPP